MINPEWIKAVQRDNERGYGIMPILCIPNQYKTMNTQLENVRRDFRCFIVEALANFRFEALSSDRFKIIDPVTGAEWLATPGLKIYDTRGDYVRDAYAFTLTREMD